ncbi:ATP-dependent DNA helicase [Lecanosticta acicola]|uniref:ATP-dependent DNA helicase n=1 Tax=Lecanosticta acicola TaxID=111012 RepID=A0AAI8Z9A6_9PEZI|nr:ATP-dependent DNA helicase [Lecanosticta acicola]
MGQPSEDDFGLSSDVEEALLRIDTTTCATGGKRKSESDDALNTETKRARVGQPDDSQLDDTASDTSTDVARRVLRERFGMEAFRLKQEAAIARLLDGKSSVVVFPTGGGKSLCYQVPALCFKELDKLSGIRQTTAEPGITLVVSPLIALMKDQVDALQRRGIAAAVMDSTKTKEQYLQTMTMMRNGELDILYCAPERLNNEGFVSSMANVKGGVRLLAVDEAHCISEWGHAFRPDYLKVARFAKEIGAERVVCLTATATPQVAQDVCKAFDIPETGLFRTSTYRPNLRLQAQAYQTKAESYPKLRAFLKAHPGPTIIYVTLQQQAEELAQRLINLNFNAAYFHAGMKNEDKVLVQERFMASDDGIVVATIAFGMGIDKADIRNIVHYDIPRSLEGYSQEIGRAGRDGKESHCMLYLCAEDFHLRESFARGDLPSKKSVSELLRSIFSLHPTPAPESALEVSFYHLSKEHDIKLTTLGNIFCALELRFGLIRAKTPKYGKYSWKLLGNIKWDSSPAGTAVNGCASCGKTVWTVDVDVAAQQGGVSRGDIVTKLNAWNDQGLIDLTASNVFNVFRVQKQWPLPAKEQDDILNALYKDLEVREMQAMERMKEVMDLITDEACLSRSLAQHFGDRLPDDASECGHCTWCETRTAVEKVEPRKREWNSGAFSKILEAVPDRDDARYLARIAFGISSPRVTAAKLSKSAVLGSMEDQDFMTLLNAFTKICEK